MTEFKDDTGLLGRANSNAHAEADSLDDASRALVSLIDGGSMTDAVEFAQGAIDMMCAIAAVLIGRGIPEPDAFQKEAAEYEALWTGRQNHSRAVAAKLFRQRLKTIEQTKKRKVYEQMVIPDSCGGH
jgi:hypothetical protein